MKKNHIGLIAAAALAALLAGSSLAAQTDRTLRVTSSQFTPGAAMSAPSNDGGTVTFVLEDRDHVPFTQQAVHQTPARKLKGVRAMEKPYYHISLALPIPSAYTPTEQGEMAGLDYGNYHHHHSPGFTILENGDALAIAFSSPRGRTESDTAATFVQYRRRYGSEEWDMPELFYDTHDGNDQSGLLWQDGEKTWFFGGGRYMSDWIPFRICTSTDNGRTWTYFVPQLDKAATDFTAQPITNAFRDPDGNIYMSCDAGGSQSFLWRSSDDGLHWHDMGGRTATRHSAIIPLDDKGTLLSIGGKSNNIDGWNPKNISTNWGETWDEGVAGPLTVNGSAQRPTITRLQSGALVVVGDSYLHKLNRPAPEGWTCGDQCYIGISDDNGETWTFKILPLCMGHNQRPAHPTLGYSSVNQGPDGNIHILASATFPAYEIELNEAWIRDPQAGVNLTSEGQSGVQLFDSKADGTRGGLVRVYKEKYADGQLRSKWHARICRNGKYLLHGKVVDYYPDGTKMHEAVYRNGYKKGVETYWAPDGSVIWTWDRNLKTHKGVWTQFWPNGQKKVQSGWNIRPATRDLPGNVFSGYVAEGPACHWDKEGNLTATYVFENGLLKE